MKKVKKKAKKWPLRATRTLKIEKMIALHIFYYSIISTYYNIICIFYYYDMTQSDIVNVTMWCDIIEKISRDRKIFVSATKVVADPYLM